MRVLYQEVCLQPAFNLPEGAWCDVLATPPVLDEFLQAVRRYPHLPRRRARCAICSRVCRDAPALASALSGWGGGVATAVARSGATVSRSHYRLRAAILATAGRLRLRWNSPLPPIHCAAAGCCKISRLQPLRVSPSRRGI